MSPSQRLPLLAVALLSALASRASAQYPAPTPPPREPGVLRVVCLGDSLTGDRPGKPYLHQYLKWPDLLALTLETRLGKAEVFNAGWGGDATYARGDRPGGLKRVDSDVLPFQPDIVVVLIGGNNFSEKTKSTEDISTKLKEDLTAIVTKIKGAGIRVLLMQYPEPKSADMAKVWAHLDDGNPVIAEVAQMQRIPTLELAPAFAEAEQTHPLAALLNPVDGVHLQPYGEIVMARAVFQKLVELGWVSEPKPYPLRHSTRDPR